MNKPIQRPIPFATQRATHSEPVFSAAECVAAFRRHGVAILVWIAFCMAVGAAWVASTPSEYVATALILLEPHRAEAPASGAEMSIQPALDTAAADSQIQVVKSERLLRFVFDSLGLAHTPEFVERPADYRSWLESKLPAGLATLFARKADPEVSALATSELQFLKFMNKVSVRRLGQSYVLEVSYSGPSGEIAAQRANSISMAYVRDQIEDKIASTRGEELLQSRIADIGKESQDAMMAVMSGEIPAARFPDAGARVISGALVPLHRSSPQPTLTLAFAATLGAFSALAFVFLRLGADNSLRSRGQVVAASGVDCLACLPLNRRSPPRLESGDGLANVGVANGLLRSLSSVRTVVLSAFSNAPSLTIGIVSVYPGEGKTFVAANLARMIAESQGCAVLVDGNFLNPTLTKNSSQDFVFGLSDALRGAHPPELRSPDRNGLRFVPAYSQRRAPDLHLFAGGQLMRDFIEDLRVNRFVIVDAPAISVSSDALAFAQFLDGVIFVAESGKVTSTELREAVAAFGAKTHVLGVILNKVRGVPQNGR